MRGTAKRPRLSNEDYYGKGGHNKIYQNDRFVLRITKLRLNPGSDAEFDKNIHLDVEEKYDDEKMFLQAVKRGLCPNIYFLGNIENNGGRTNLYLVLFEDRLLELNFSQ